MFSVILVPKFSEFITLSILAFIHNNFLLHCIYSGYCVLCVRKFQARAVVRGFLGASI
jgi:hypothetical protein